MDLFVCCWWWSCIIRVSGLSMNNNLTLADVSDMHDANLRHTNRLIKKTSVTTCTSSAFFSPCGDMQYMQNAPHIKTRAIVQWLLCGTLQIQKTHANWKNTCKLRIHLHQFDSTCAVNTRNTAYYKNTLQNLTTQTNNEMCMYHRPQQNYHNKTKINHVFFCFGILLWLFWSQAKYHQAHSLL